MSDIETQRTAVHASMCTSMSYSAPVWKTSSQPEKDERTFTPRVTAPQFPISDLRRTQDASSRISRVVAWLLLAVAIGSTAIGIVW